MFAPPPEQRLEAETQQALEQAKALEMELTQAKEKVEKECQRAMAAELKAAEAKAAAAVEVAAATKAVAAPTAAKPVAPAAAKPAQTNWEKASAKAAPKAKPKPRSELAKMVQQVASVSTGAELDAEDVEGLGNDDFYALMKKRAADYFASDHDGDGQLDFEEFKFLIAQRADAKEFKQETLRQLFDALDVDKSGKLDMAEYILWAMRESLAKARGKVLDLFRAWDADGSGMIDRQEFQVVLYALGFRCSEQVMKGVFAHLDKDGSGELEYREMNNALRRGMTTSKLNEPKPPTDRRKSSAAPPRRATIAVQPSGGK
jgi:Ca2+-binding EF-hand superfamily protein